MQWLPLLSVLLLVPVVVGQSVTMWISKIEHMDSNCDDLTSWGDWALIAWTWFDTDTAQVSTGCLYQSNKKTYTGTGTWAQKGPATGVSTLHVKMRANEDDGLGSDCDEDLTDDCKLNKECSHGVTIGQVGSFTCG
eukprot:Hpha_TRINITY_DN30915_c0_g1::TRINITY_DN30915_c0_g1_i1::g.112263::m.112263